MNLKICNTNIKLNVFELSLFIVYLTLVASTTFPGGHMYECLHFVVFIINSKYRLNI